MDFARERVYSWNEIEINARQFSHEWRDAHYEKGETHSFYNDFFQVFGISRRRVARYEEHVKSDFGDSGFIDLLWPGVLIVEQKSAGLDLEPAESQAGNYFDLLPDGKKPRFQLVSDFQTFILVDRDEGVKAEFELKDLADNVRLFSFMLGLQSPRNQPKLDLDERAASLIGKIHDILIKSGFPANDTHVFLTRIVFCLFADNTGLFQPRGRFLDLIISRTDENGNGLGEIISHLFQVLDTIYEERQDGLDPELVLFPYLDGGLFEEVVRIPSLNRDVRSILIEACHYDWSAVSPSIFGALFSSILSEEARRSAGAYSTSIDNILKVLEDLFLVDLRQSLDKAKQKIPEGPSLLYEFLEGIKKLQVFDPACGCGNFLVVAYQELRKLESEAIMILANHFKIENPRALSSVDVDQFHGIEAHSYSARIAKAALWMADHLSNRELSLSLFLEYKRIPLDASANIAIGDALKLKWEHVVTASPSLYIVGNPPYKGSKKQSQEEKGNLWRILHPDGGSSTTDLVTGWIFKSAEMAEKGASVGLVATNSVVQGEQVAQIWPLLFARYAIEIEFAHRPFKWFVSESTTSAVWVVVIGFRATSLVRPTRTIYEYDDNAEVSGIRHGNVLSPYLIVADSLTDPLTVVSKESSPINGLPRLRTGSKPIDGGYYILTEEEKSAIIDQHPSVANVIRPYVGNEEFLSGTPRNIIIPSLLSPNDLAEMNMVLDLVRKVDLYRNKQIPNKRGNSFKPTVGGVAGGPTQFHISVFPDHPFLFIGEVGSERREYVPMGWLQPPMIPSNLGNVAIGVTKKQFGILQSKMHYAWLSYIGGRLEGRFRYSIGIVYNTFPMAHNVPDRIELLTDELLLARDAYMADGLNMRTLYDPITMPLDLRRLHHAIDAVVDRSYMGQEASSDLDRVECLLNMYRERLDA